jgi:hypothetical protein
MAAHALIHTQFTHACSQLHHGSLSKDALAAALTAQADSIDEATCAAQEAEERGHGGGGDAPTSGAAAGGATSGASGSASGGGGGGAKGKKGSSSSGGGGDGSAGGRRNCYLVALPDADAAEGGGGGVAAWAEAPYGGHVSALLPALHHPAFSLRLFRDCLHNPAPAQAHKSKS